jgi:hypothetical protein
MTQATLYVPKYFLLNESNAVLVNPGSNVSANSPLAGGIYGPYTINAYGFLFCGLTTKEGGAAIRPMIIAPGQTPQIINPASFGGSNFPFYDGIPILQEGAWFKLPQLNSTWYFGTGDSGTGYDGSLVFLVLDDTCYDFGFMGDGTQG